MERVGIKVGRAVGMRCWEIGIEIGGRVGFSNTGKLVGILNGTSVGPG